MPSSSPPSPPSHRRGIAGVVRLVDRLAARLGALGMGAFGWPLAIGTGLGTALSAVMTQTAKADFAARHPWANFAVHGWPPVALMTLGAVLWAVGVATLRKRLGDDRSFVALYRQTLHRFAFLSALPAILAFKEPIEVPRGWLLLALAVLAGALGTYSAYHFAAEERDSEEPGDRAAERRGKRVGFLVAAVVALAMAAYSFFTIRLVFVNHLSFNTGRSDLGYYLSVFRQSSEGIPLGCSLCGGGSHVTGHFDPLLVLLSPTFLIYPFAETLLVLQTLWLASGAIPVYLLGRHHVGHRGAGVALAIAYLAYPALHGVNLFDFHSIALCIPPLLWFLYFLERERARAAYLMLGLCLLVREDVSLATLLIGVSLIFSGVPRRVRMGFMTIVLSVAYFLVAKLAFMGHADPLNATAGGRGYSQFYEELIPAGRSTGALLGTLIGDPLFALSRILTESKLDYVALLFAPLLFLPLVAKGRIQLAYGFAVTLLATAHLYSVHAQYSSTLVPVLFGLAAAALGRIRHTSSLPVRVSGPRLAKALAFGVLVSTLLCSWKFGGLVPNESFIAGFRPLVREASAESRAFDAWLRQRALAFPKGAKVAANSRIIPHLGPVHGLYMIEDRRNADYVIVNMKNREIARLILADEALGYLVQVDTNAHLRIYRTKYPPSMKHGPKDAAVEVESPGGT
jgi:uncharacterized membrane protein